jgi:hypothetical protein
VEAEAAARPAAVVATAEVGEGRVEAAGLEAGPAAEASTAAAAAQEEEAAAVPEVEAAAKVAAAKEAVAAGPAGSAVLWRATTAASSGLTPDPRPRGRLPAWTPVGGVGAEPARVPASPSGNERDG